MPEHNWVASFFSGPLHYSQTVHRYQLCLHGKIVRPEALLLVLGMCLLCCSSKSVCLLYAGISAVLETGWQNERVYDPITRVSSMQQTRISKASQLQRRGRAGRTQPGTCYTLYSQEDLAKFPDENTPDVLKSNLDAFLLGMVAADLDPTVLKQDEKTNVELLNHEELGYAAVCFSLHAAAEVASANVHSCQAHLCLGSQCCIPDCCTCCVQGTLEPHCHPCAASCQVVWPAQRILQWGSCTAHLHVQQAGIKQPVCT